MAIIQLRPRRQAEHEQFEKLMQPHLHQLYRLAFRFTGNQSDAEDLVQDVVVKLYPRLQEMQTVEQLGPWLARVLYRHFIDHTRSRKRSPLHLVDDDTDFEEQNGELPGPGENTETTILQHRLQHALSQLNEDQRVLMLLHDVEGYTLNEIHDILDAPVGTLKSRLNRARSRLRQLLHDMEPFAVGKRVNE